MNTSNTWTYSINMLSTAWSVRQPAIRLWNQRSRLWTRSKYVETLKSLTMRDYLELYLFTDVCLLADVFQTFRATSKEAYELDQHNLWVRLSLPGTRCFDLSSDLSSSSLTPRCIEWSSRLCAEASVMPVFDMRVRTISIWARYSTRMRRAHSSSTSMRQTCTVRRCRMRCRTVTLHGSPTTSVARLKYLYPAARKCAKPSSSWSGEPVGIKFSGGSRIPTGDSRPRRRLSDGTGADENYTWNALRDTAQPPSQVLQCCVAGKQKADLFIAGQRDTSYLVIFNI